MTWSITLDTLHGIIFIKNASISSTNVTPNCTPMMIPVVETFIAIITIICFANECIYIGYNCKMGSVFIGNVI